MALRFGSRGIESRFEAYVEALSASLRHADRAGPFRSYCAGLILPGERKSVEPMAARIEPGRVQAAHQSLHHLVAKAEWSDQAVLASIRDQVLPKITQRGGVRVSDLDPAHLVECNGIPKANQADLSVRSERA